MSSKIKLHITDERMLQFMDYCIAQELEGVRTAKAWCDKTGTRSTNIYNIRNGMQQFTKEQILQTCTVFQVRADFFFGLTNEMFSEKAGLSPLDRIKEAVAELEQKERKVVEAPITRKIRITRRSA